MKRKSPLYEDLLEAAREAAFAAGAIIKRSFRDRTDIGIRLKERNDFVTRVDNDAEAAISGTLHRHFPDHQILAEEGGFRHPQSPFLWVIDPLDGTANYIRGIPQFAVSLGLMEEDQPLFGLIYNPVLDEQFHAFRGKGSFRNHEPIRVSETGRLNLAFGATGFPFKQHGMLPEYLSAFEEIMRKTIDMRRCGSAALDLAYTACGRYDFFWEAFLQPWDFVAGALLIQEAGGRITNFAGQPLKIHSDSVIAANRQIYDEITGMIQRIFIRS
jgi:myo-inositol-1(or 4)-monophosphatase